MKLQILIIVMLAHLVVGCGSPSALVHLTYPDDFTIEEGAVLKGNGSASLNLNFGRRTIFFSRKGKAYAAVLDIQSGGEIYASLAAEDICQVKAMRELR